MKLDQEIKGSSSTAYELNGEESKHVLADNAGGHLMQLV